MRRALVAAGVAAVLTVAGATYAVAAGEQVPVGCTITDNVLSCPLPEPAPAATVTVTEVPGAATVTETATATETATVTADPVTHTETVTATETPAPVTVFSTVTAPPVTATVTAAPTTPVATTPVASTPVTTTAVTTTTAASTTAPTTTTPPPVTGSNCAYNPSDCGFPDATNTGARGTLRKIPQDVSSGPGWRSNGSTVAVDGPGTVFEGFEVSGDLNIVADNVTVRNVKITESGESFGIAIRHADNTVIENVTIAPAGGRLMVGIKDIYGDTTGTVVRRADIANTSTGVQIYGGLIEDSYIHDMGLLPGDHINGTTSNGSTTPLVIRHNTILNKYNQTDAVSFFQDFGVEANRTVDNNLLAGGGYVIYGGDGGKGKATNIKITNNRISRMYYPKGGYWGWLAAFTASNSGNVLSGNVWDDTGSPVN